MGRRWRISFQMLPSTTKKVPAPKGKLTQSTLPGMFMMMSRPVLAPAFEDVSEAYLWNVESVTKAADQNIEGKPVVALEFKYKFSDDKGVLLIDPKTNFPRRFTYNTKSAGKTVVNTVEFLTVTPDADVKNSEFAIPAQ